MCLNPKVKLKNLSVDSFLDLSEYPVDTVCETRNFGYFVFAKNSVDMSLKEIPVLRINYRPKTDTLVFELRKDFPCKEAEQKTVYNTLAESILDHFEVS